MTWMSHLTALLTGDHQERAERYRREGKREKALAAYLKAGNWRQAGRMALELGDPAQAVRLLVEGALGATGAAYFDSSPAQAGEVLAAAGHLEEALLLLDAGGAFRPAANLALKLRQPGRAAVYFERARDFDRAATHYEEAGRLADALRALEAEASLLSQAARRTQGTAASQEVRRAVELRRAELLTRLGRKGEALKLLRAWGLPAQAARHLEAAGKFREAAEAFLEADEPQEAYRVVGRAAGLPPRTAAQIYLKAGHPEQAAPILAGLGALREAAEAYEAGGDWEKAANQWQSVREYAKAAQTFRRAGRLHEAARCFELGGEPARAAEAFALAGDHQAAGAAFQRAGRFLDAGRHLLEAGSRSAAARALEQVPPGSSEFADATLKLVPMLAEEGQHEAALDRLRKLPPEAQPTGLAAAERLYWEGRALEGMGRAEQALTCYRELITQRRDFRDAARRVAELTERFGRERPPGPEPVAAAALGPGSVLAGRYDIQGELGRGGMGRVYKALDRELNEVVAIKTLLRPDLESAGEEEERLLREVQICRRITHPNVLRVYDLGRVPGGIFITMEYLEGKRLDSLIGGEPLPLGQVKDILSQIAAGLGEAHHLGVIHRDLKPGNIILTQRYLKILDFGIARMTDRDSRLTRTGVAIGSPLYMSPEQIEGLELDGRSDLYSVGVLAFALLAGREPFGGTSTASVVFAQLYTPVPDLRRFRADLPDSWREFVEKLLAKKPEERFASAGEVLEALSSLPA
jgi:tetratricopeptide (TPR) repeat protein